MASHKAGGSSGNGRKSIAKRLGVKLFGGQKAKSGSIIIRQRGSTFHAGEGVCMGKDYTIFAKLEGHVFFTIKRGGRKYVNIAAAEAN